MVPTICSIATNKEAKALKIQNTHDCDRFLLDEYLQDVKELAQQSKKFLEEGVGEVKRPNLVGLIGLGLKAKEIKIEFDKSYEVSVVKDRLFSQWLGTLYPSNPIDTFNLENFSNEIEQIPKLSKLTQKMSPNQEETKEAPTKYLSIPNP